MRGHLEIVGDEVRRCASFHRISERVLLVWRYPPGCPMGRSGSGPSPAWGAICCRRTRRARRDRSGGNARVEARVEARVDGADARGLRLAVARGGDQGVVAGWDEVEDGVSGNQLAVLAVAAGGLVDRVARAGGVAADDVAGLAYPRLHAGRFIAIGVALVALEPIERRFAELTPQAWGVGVQAIEARVVGETGLAGIDAAEAVGESVEISHGLIDRLKQADAVWIQAERVAMEVRGGISGREMAEISPAGWRWRVRLRVAPSRGDPLARDR